MKWNIRHGKFWMIQWGRPIFFSLGVHIDPRVPYIDFHLIAMILTIGNLDKTYKDYKAWWSSRSL
jgi:hypothetical protein